FDRTPEQAAGCVQPLDKGLASKLVNRTGVREGTAEGQRRTHADRLAIRSGGACVIRFALAGRGRDQQDHRTGQRDQATDCVAAHGQPTLLGSRSQVGHQWWAVPSSVALMVVVVICPLWKATALP